MLLCIHLLMQVLFFSGKVSSCPPGTQEASLDITKAYRNSPIFPQHKRNHVCTGKAVCLSNTSQLNAKYSLVEFRAMWLTQWLHYLNFTKWSPSLSGWTISSSSGPP